MELQESLRTYCMHKTPPKLLFTYISLVAVQYVCHVFALLQHPSFLRVYHLSDIQENPLTFAEWLSARPRPVGEADPLSRAVQGVTDCTGEAHFAAHFKVARFSAGMGRSARIPTGSCRIACNGR